MTPQELKASILQLAIQGKLVEQREEEGAGIALAKELNCSPIEDNTPFDIPDTWCWCRLEDIVIKPIKRGKSPTYTKESNTLVFAQKCNTKAGNIDLSLCLYLDESKLSKYPAEEYMRDSDIVINSTGNGTLGRVGIYHDSDNALQLQIVPDSHVTVIRVNKSLSKMYVYYILKYYQPYMEKLGPGSTNQTELSANIVMSTCPITIERSGNGSSRLTRICAPCTTQ